MSRRETFDIRPSGTAILRACRKNYGAITDAALVLYEIRKLLTGRDGRPVPVAGSCGFGSWREHEREAAG